ncbi:bacillithiol system redox-active protein YtxJ [Halalkalibacter akibai]|uniref:General stress protein n=1 Tax=Halalkalibacter akibai (strain ATCC 43226 / DSM 21942 / CIP 109018 / JCM 9157 / 1139) TaxID=1236973 RepID=W4QXA2_HALA3|nr:bacillithiol system redox-active protein YtxJ [Halalkalibacter akibai]GAE36527.1 general stress protein [Halalkalibacter akibai JCM 9157]
MILLETLEDWGNLYEATQNKTVILLKHSTTCPVSAAAYDEFQDFQEEHSNLEFALVKVIEHRPVSNAIAEQLGVKHESPQCFIIKDKQVIWVDSHWKITAKNLKNAVS